VLESDRTILVAIESQSAAALVHEAGVRQCASQIPALALYDHFATKSTVAKLIFCGHSIGGSVAAVCVADLYERLKGACTGPEIIAITFGAPDFLTQKPPSTSVGNLPKPCDELIFNFVAHRDVMPAVLGTAAQLLESKLDNYEHVSRFIRSSWGLLAASASGATHAVDDQFSDRWRVAKQFILPEQSPLQRWGRWYALAAGANPQDTRLGGKESVCVAEEMLSGELIAELHSINRYLHLVQGEAPNIATGDSQRPIATTAASLSPPNITIGRAWVVQDGDRLQISLDGRNLAMLHTLAVRARTASSQVLLAAEADVAIRRLPSDGSAVMCVGCGDWELSEESTVELKAISVFDAGVAGWQSEEWWREGRHIVKPTDMRRTARLSRLERIFSRSVVGTEVLRTAFIRGTLERSTELSAHLAALERVATGGSLLESVSHQYRIRLLDRLHHEVVSSVVEAIVAWLQTPLVLRIPAISRPGDAFRALINAGATKRSTGNTDIVVCLPSYLETLRALCDSLKPDAQSEFSS
jgi:pimeloyl-ACP methyl ester carboxylesterase